MKNYKESLESYINTILDESRINIKSKRRHNELIDLVRIFCYYAKKQFPKLALEKIGLFINRDHATVLHHIKSYKALCFSDSKFKAQAEYYITLFCAIDGYSRPEPNKEELQKLINLASEVTRGVWLEMIKETPLVKKALTIETSEIYQLEANE